MVKQLSSRRGQLGLLEFSELGRGLKGGQLEMMFFQSKAMIAVKREGNVAVHPDAMLDRFGFLFAIEQRLPRVDMLRLVEITARDERHLHLAALENGPELVDFEEPSLAATRG